MEYDIDRLDEAIFYCLSLHPDAFLTPVRIYNWISNQSICPALNPTDRNERDSLKIRFNCICRTLDTRFKNVHILRDSINPDIPYLIMTNKAKIEAEKEFIRQNFSSYIPEFDELNTMSLQTIEYMIKNPEFSATLDFSEFVDGTDTILHILCKDCRLDLIEYLLDMYDIDINIKNLHGLTPYELLPFDHNDDSVKIITKLLKYEYDTQVNKIKTNLRDIREMNTKLVNTNTKLAQNLELVGEKMRFVTRENTRLGKNNNRMISIIFAETVAFVGFVAWTFMQSA